MKSERLKYGKWIVFTLCLFVLCALAPGGKARAAGYMIKVNKQQNVVTIYKNTDGSYKACKAFVCSAGYATPTGTFSLGEKMRWHTLDGPSYGQYCSRIYNGFLFHSVWYYQRQKNSQSYVQYNRLGTTASHGCVRLTVADAKWIYDNCPSGSKVVIYNSSDPGPLGKPRAMKVRGSTGWDPTDPDPANPYRNKKPSIQGAEDKKLGYGSKFNINDGITVRNSNGYDAKSMLKTSILYRIDNNSKYKPVKKVNTKKPGNYKVTYSITDEIAHTAKVTVMYKVLTGVQVGSIKLNASNKTLYLGGGKSERQFTLQVKKIKPANATTKEVRYTSSRPEVASVSAKGGVVKAKKAGTAVITASAQDGSGISGTCIVKVVQRATKMKLTAAGSTLTVGNAIQLRAVFTPASVKKPSLIWKSSNKDIATVNASGSVKALKAGKVVITATAKGNSKLRATYTLTIKYAYAKVVTTIPKVSVPVGTAWADAVKKLPATVQIADAYGNKANAAVTWASANYKPTPAGSYTAAGTIKLPAGWQGKLPVLSATVTVTAPAPTPTPAPSPAPTSGTVTGGGTVIILK